jgi:hypothetical protein
MAKRSYGTADDDDKREKNETSISKLARLHEEAIASRKSPQEDSDVEDDDDPFSTEGFADDLDDNDLHNFPTPNTPDEFSVTLQQLLQSEQDQISVQDESELEEDKEDDVSSAMDDQLDSTEPGENDVADNSLPHTDTFTTDDQAMVELIQCCNKAGTSLKFLDGFLLVLKRHIRKGFDVLKAPKRSNFMDKLRKRVSSPTATVVVSPSGFIVPKFPVLDQIVDLFSMPWFQKPECCSVNADPAIRFHQYIPTEEEGYSEVSGAKWHKRTYDLKIGTNPTYCDPDTGIVYQNVLTGMAVYNDKTGVGAIDGKYSLEPAMFSLTILKREFRENAEAWRHLGFIPQYNSLKTENEEDDTDAEARLGTFHEILSILLEDVAELQRNPPLLCLFLFGEWVNVRLILEVAFVIGDQLSQDQHCARKKVNGGGAGRAHRYCMTSFLNAGNAAHECTPLKKEVIDELTETIVQGENHDKRSRIVNAAYPDPDPNLPARHADRTINRNRRISFHAYLKTRAAVARDIVEKTYGLYPVRNAWTPISFGSNPNGIHRAALDDAMHFNSAGTFMYLGHTSFKGLTASECKVIEKYLREDFGSRCSVRYDFPRGKFTVGFTNCTLLTASEKVGLMFSFYFSLGTERVEAVMQKAILRQQNRYLDNEFCCQILSKSVNMKPTELDLPKIYDKYFFVDRKREKAAEKKKSADAASLRLPRHLRGVRKIVDHLDGLRLMFAVDPEQPLDELQTEYILQAVWYRSARKGTVPLLEAGAVIPSSFHGDIVGNGNEANSNDTVKGSVSDMLANNMRRGDPSLSYQSANVQEADARKKRAAPPPPSSTKLTRIAKYIPKHWIDKPKQSGRGETSAILTDVHGYRSVLEHALIFHAIVHEFHELEAVIQKDTNHLEDRIRECMDVVLDGIYRGDNTVDINTGKIHSHFHLARATEEYGAPMGFDANLGERGLQSWAKHVSKTARKCGDATFVTQTAKRVADHLLLAKVKRFYQVDEDTVRKSPLDLCPGETWKYTRRKCHMTFNLGSGESETLLPKEFCEDENKKLLLPLVRSKLKECHGDNGVVRIWKEILLAPSPGARQYIRAFHFFDEYGPFFDWVQVKNTDNNSDQYIPGKVLLLYSVEGDNFAMVWMAKKATAAERMQETNISARWKMDFTADGTPAIVSVPTDSLSGCLFVFEHIKPRGAHIPLNPVVEEKRDSYIIDEAYERYSWALNFLDPSRWKNS